MTTLAIHLNNGKVVEKWHVMTYWLDEKYLNVRVPFGNASETEMYDRKKIIAIFEVYEDDKRRII